MLRWRLRGLVSGTVVLLTGASSLFGSGCQSHSEDRAEFASLQKQVAALTRQLEETRTQVELLERQGRQVSATLQNVETKIAQLKSLEPPAAVAAPDNPAAHHIAPTANQPSDVALPFGDDPAGESALPLKTQVACSEVWRLLGEGTSLERISTMLGATPEAVEQCEQKIGRRSREGGEG